MVDIDIFAKTSSCVDIKNDVVSEIDFEIMKAIKKANDSLADELTKYKRAFEIFKGRKVQVYPKFDGNTQYVITLNKNEYELLEELMNNAED